MKRKCETEGEEKEKWKGMGGGGKSRELLSITLSPQEKHGIYSHYSLGIDWLFGQ
jgi:hypothetical protein